MCVMAPPMVVCLEVQLTRGMPRSYDREGGDFLLVDGQGAAKTGAGLYDLNPKP